MGEALRNWMFARVAVLCGALCGVLSCGVADALAQSAAALPSLSPDQPVLFEARELGYDRKNARVVAVGSVEVVQGAYILLADRMTYDQTRNIVTASGNVSVVQPDGHVYFAEEAELKDDLKQGVVENFRARLVDNSLFAAREARRVNENVTEMTRAVYSPCKLCPGKNGEERDPLWQIKAEKVTHDEAAQRITYRNAFFEVYGVPVAYSPYLSHATPGADNKSGLLIPEYTQSSLLGTVIRVPYFVSLSPSYDVTVTPIVTSKEGPILGLEYRQKTDNGEMQFDGSATNPDRRDASGTVIPGREFRGHVRGKGSFALSEYWGWGFDINRASDDTYLRRYGYGNEDTLTSRAFVERVEGRSYVGLQSLAFQGLTVRDDPDRTPYVAPLLDAEYETAPGFAGSRFAFSANALALGRQIGADSRRISATGAWKLPYATDNGQVMELKAEVRADGYDVANVAGPSGRQFDGTVSRVVPQVTAQWRYPFLNQLSDASIIVEPAVMAIAAPRGNNPAEIPNEDTLAVEFSDANLFSDRRYPGLDRVENGARIAYGVRGQVKMRDNRNLHLLFGQNYSVDNHDLFPYGRDPGEHFSDYVGRVALEYAPLDIAYRFRLDQSDFSLRRSEINSSLSYHPVYLGVDYIDVSDDPLILDNGKELLASTAITLNDNWSFTAAGRRNLENKGGMVAASSGLLFQNECIKVLTNVNRTFTRDRDIEPSTSVNVRVALKNLE